MESRTDGSYAEPASCAAERVQADGRLLQRSFYFRFPARFSWRLSAALYQRRSLAQATQGANLVHTFVGEQEAAAQPNKPVQWTSLRSATDFVR